MSEILLMHCALFFPQFNAIQLATSDYIIYFEHGDLPLPFNRRLTTHIMLPPP